MTPVGSNSASKGPRNRPRARLLGDKRVEITLPELPWVIYVRTEEISGVPQIVDLHLEPRESARSEDQAITAERLRALPVGVLRQLAIATTPETLNIEAALKTLITRTAKRPDGTWPDEHYMHVADTYRNAVKAGQPPLQVIQKLWSVSHASAAKYVQTARHKGFLGFPTKPGVAGADAKGSPFDSATTERKRRNK